MQVPIVLVSGVDPDAATAAMVSLQFDLPDAVSVRHRIDVEAQTLERIVSDVSGLVERTVLEMEHACITCALREDILPTLVRLAEDGRWRSVVVHMPTGAPAAHVCSVIARDARLLRLVRVAAAVTVVGSDPVEDLLGDALLVERGLHSSTADRRGVGEVLSQMVEHADVVVGAHGLDPVSHDLLAALTRPEVAVLDGADQLDGPLLVEGLHDHTRTSTWTDPLRLGDLPPLDTSRVWRLDLRSEAPFEPERLLQQVGRLGSGRHRSRGRFWLPTRPGRVLEWAGAGGQLSIGTLDAWGDRPPRTRLLFTGTGTPPADLIEAFGDLLARDSTPQRPDEDGFEPWLGPIGEVA